jgi:DNA-binding response OmpR family regulator
MIPPCGYAFSPAGRKSTQAAIRKQRSLQSCPQRKEGLARTREGKPGLALVDIGMPDLNGFYLLKVVSADDGI